MFFEDEQIGKLGPFSQMIYRWGWPVRHKFMHTLVRGYIVYTSRLYLLFNNS